MMETIRNRVVNVYDGQCAWRLPVVSIYPADAELDGEDGLEILVSERNCQLYTLWMKFSFGAALCPDNRGFGERRDEALRGDPEEQFLNSTCFQLAHMAEPLGQTVIGMCTWDAMRLIDYVCQRGNGIQRIWAVLAFPSGECRHSGWRTCVISDR